MAGLTPLAGESEAVAVAEPAAPGPGAAAGAADDAPLGPLLRPDALGAWAWVLGYTAVLTSLSVLRYELWLATGWDLGFNEQAMWLALHRGLGAASSFTGQPFLADAAAYVLAALAPLYAAGGPGLILLLQSLAFGLGYLFLRRVAAELGVPPRRAHLLGMLYLVYPVVLGANLFDFHPDALGVPLLFAAVWAALRRRPGLYAALVGAALLVKDTVPLVVAGMGVALLVRRRPGWGLATLAAAAAVAVLDVHVLIRGLTHGAGMRQWTALYAGLGPTPAAGLVHLARHPQALLGWVRRPRAWEYLAWVFGPLVPALAAGWRRLLRPWWLPALALLESNLLSPAPVMTDPFNQLTVLAVPFLFTAAADALAAEPGGRPAPRLARRWLAVPAAFLAVFAWHEYRLAWRPVPRDGAALQAAVAEVPPAAPAVVPNNVAPHVADRSRLWLVGWPLPALPRGTYVLLTPGLARSGLGDPAALRALERALAAPGAAVRTFAQDGVTLYRLRRALPPPAGGAPGPSGAAGD